MKAPTFEWREEIVWFGGAVVFFFAQLWLVQGAIELLFKFLNKFV